MKSQSKYLSGLILLLSVMALQGCTSTSQVLNPFYESPSENALKGEANDHLLRGSESRQDGARKALEAMSTYQRAHTPEPAKPVINPAVVRLMWVPDHLNTGGDLVPAHYYYLKVKSEDWAVQDAFELESQLHGRKGNPGNTPYIVKK